MTITTPWSPVGYLVYKRTYARPKPDTVDETEDWGETVDRVIRSCRDQLNCGFTPDEEQRLREYHLKLKGTVSGRKLWQCGTETVDKLGLASMQNC